MKKPASARNRLIAIPVVCVLAAALLMAPVIIAERTLERGRRFDPELEGWLGNLAYAACLLPLLVLLVLLATVGRRALAARAWHFKTLYAIGVVVLQLAAATAMVLGAIASSQNLLKSSWANVCATSPDGLRRACLYQGGVMCGYDVSVGPRDGHVLHQEQSISRNCDQMRPGAKLRWGGARGDEIEVIGADGQKLTSTSWGFSLGH